MQKKVLNWLSNRNELKIRKLYIEGAPLSLAAIRIHKCAAAHIYSAHSSRRGAITSFLFMVWNTVDCIVSKISNPSLGNDSRSQAHNLMPQFDMTHLAFHMRSNLFPKWRFRNHLYEQHLGYYAGMLHNTRSINLQIQVPNVKAAFEVGLPELESRRWRC